MRILLYIRFYLHHAESTMDNHMSSEANNTSNSFYLDRPEWVDKVVRNKDQSVVHPMQFK